MQLKTIRCSYLSRARNIAITDRFLIAVTGGCAHILDKELHLIKTVKGMQYMVQAYVSPDESKLLLVPTENRFYLLSLEDFTLERFTLKKPYNGNLEGRGCWSMDGKFLYLLAGNSRTNNSALRCYGVTDGSSYVYTDLFAERYWLTDIRPVKELNRYLLTGLERKPHEPADTWNLLWFDGSSLEAYPLKEMEDDVVSSVEYDAVTQTVIVYGLFKTMRFDIHGNFVSTFSVPEAGKVTSSFSDVFADIGLDPEAFDSLKELCDWYGFENISIDDSINKLCLSSDGKRYYVGTHLGLFVLDAESKAILAKQKIEFGVQNIVELSPDLIAASTWNGVKLFQILA